MSLISLWVDCKYQKTRVWSVPTLFRIPFGTWKTPFFERCDIHLKLCAVAAEHYCRQTPHVSRICCLQWKQLFFFFLPEVRTKLAESARMHLALHYCWDIKPHISRQIHSVKILPVLYWVQMYIYFHYMSFDSFVFGSVTLWPSLPRCHYLSEISSKD